MKPSGALLSTAMLVAAACSASGLSVSPSGHYIVYKGRTLMLFGDSGTQCVTQNANLDYRAWVDDCHDRGIPMVHVWSFTPPRQLQDGSDIEDRWGYVYPGITPWARKNDGSQARDQLSQWDLRTFDDGPNDSLDRYWPRLRDLCRYAEEKGIIVGITVFTGWAKHSQDFAYHPLHADNGGHLTDVKDAVRIESPGNEVCKMEWSEDWPPARKTQWVWERLSLEYINQLNGLGNVFFVFLDEHSYPEGNIGDHFLTFFKSRGAVWVDWNARRDSVDWVFSDTVAGDEKNTLAVNGFKGTPARPYLFLEGPPYQGEGVRTAIWTFAMGGGHYAFHADADQETVRTGIMGYDPHVPEGDKGMIKRDWLGHASRFFNANLITLDAMKPHNDLVTEGAYCLANPGHEYAVFIKRDAPQEVVLAVDVQEVEHEWRSYNPRNGEWGVWHNSTGKLVLTKPDKLDWAFLIRARNR
ncbi:MAG: hypothetical protein AMXMBFR84_00970 [Candidatus Hydrogenedentota bacterium]